VATSLDETSLARALRGKLAGERPAIVWEHEGDAVLVHLAALAVELSAGIVLVSVPLETDQTGRGIVSCSFAIGEAGRGGEMFAVAGELPHGDAVLVARWGRLLQEAIWSALVALVDDPSVVSGSPRHPRVRVERGVFAWTTTRGREPA